jgi:ABC-type multidrug transport system ATPase subunit
MTITITQLTKTYPGGVTALRGLDLEITTGMFGLLGPNGAGKTTLMRILAGVIHPTAGAVQVFGHDGRAPHGRQAIKSLLGYLPQELGMYPDLSAREFLDYLARLKGVTHGPTRRAQVEAALEKVRLVDVADRRIKTYSGGMKRRVGVAQALLGQPRLIIVDEPTVGLDPEERIRLRQLFAELATRCIVILSTHIVEDISQSCNDLAVIQTGQVKFRSSPQALMAEARGQVWQITTSDARPPEGMAVVSAVATAQGTQYRAVGRLPEGVAAQPLEPSLEDGYMWLMRRE